MFPELEGATNDTVVLLWACGLLVVANAAQWAWMISTQRMHRKERVETFGQLNQLIKDNTAALQNLLLHIKTHSPRMAAADD